MPGIAVYMYMYMYVVVVAIELDAYCAVLTDDYIMCWLLTCIMQCSCLVTVLSHNVLHIASLLTLLVSSKTN